MAQLIIENAQTPQLLEVYTQEDLQSTERGSNGFGSTGVKTESPKAWLNDGVETKSQAEEESGENRNLQVEPRTKTKSKIPPTAKWENSGGGV